jgi:SagB-type dehydrogenase family enzyme
MSGLTVRVESDSVIASRDGGQTKALAVGLGATLHHAYAEAVCRVGDAGPTAGTLAGLAEARTAQPRPVSIAERPPAWQDDRDGPRVPLSDLAVNDSRPLAEVLAARHSQRRWNPPTLQSVATVIVRSGRIIDWTVTPDGYVTTHRPVPSSGARHPLDIYLLAGEVSDLPVGAWRFDALRCELVGTPLRHEPALTRFGTVLGVERPPAALIAVAHLERTLSRYRTGLSLVWRDAGALLATLQLCATDLGLASCIAGTCGIAVDDRSTGVLDVGALVLGAEVGA